MLKPENRDIYQAIAEASQDTIFVLDRKGYIKYVNRHAAEFFGSSAENITGKNLQELFLPEACEFQMRAVNTVLETGQIFHTEDKKSFADRKLWLETRLIPIIEKSGIVELVLGVSRDITERKIAEEALQKSEEHFRKIFEDGPIGITIVGLDFHYIKANHRMCQIVGYSNGELIGRSKVDITHPDDIGKDMEKANQLLKGETSHFTIENRYIRKDGGIVWVDLTVSLMRNEAGQPLYFIAMVEDVTDRKHVEDELRDALIIVMEEKAKTEAIIAAMGDAVSIQDTNYKILYQNQIAKDILGDHIGEYCFRAYQKRDEVCNRCHLTVAFEKGMICRMEQSRTTDSGVRYYDITASPVKDVTGEIVAGIEMIRDVTERKQLDDAISRARDELELRVVERTSELETARDQLRSLAAHLQSVREEERTKIARDIHDELGQVLTALKMDLGWFRSNYKDHKSIFDKTGAMIEVLNATISSVKRICTELRPSMLDDFGLVAAIEWQANEFQERTGIECKVIEDPWDIELDKERSIVLYRIFQEALTNVLKHANATEAEVRLMRDDNLVIMEVTDNGKGGITDELLSKPQSFGLIGMRERVYPWGGNVEITCGQSGGTTLRISIPITKKPTD